MSVLDKAKLGRFLVGGIYVEPVNAGKLATRKQAAATARTVPIDPEPGEVAA